MKSEEENLLNDKGGNEEKQMKEWRKREGKWIDKIEATEELKIVRLLYIKVKQLAIQIYVATTFSKLYISFLAFVLESSGFS